MERVGGVFIGRRSVSVHVSVTLPGYLRGQEDPVCLESPDLFFPPTFSLKYTPQINAAKEICRTCPLLIPCREWALPQVDLDGVWGGTTPPDRKKMRKCRTS